jgi:hypothetical protein
VCGNKKENGAIVMMDSRPRVKINGSRESPRGGKAAVILLFISAARLIVIDAENRTINLAPQIRELLFALVCVQLRGKKREKVNKKQNIF